MNGVQATALAAVRALLYVATHPASTVTEIANGLILLASPSVPLLEIVL